MQLLLIFQKIKFFIRKKIKFFLRTLLVKLNVNKTDIFFNYSDKDQYQELLENSFKKALEGKSELPQWILELEGMSGKKFRSFLNFLFIENTNNLAYLEIGSWRGSTFCSAISKNSINALAIDNLSLFSGSKKILLKNIKRASCDNVNTKYKFLDVDFYQLDFDAIGKFDIYFYDGPHTEKNHFDAIDKVKNALNDEFVLIVDDWNWKEVRYGTYAALKKNNIQTLSKIEILTAKNKNPHILNGQFSDWHNGTIIISCKKTK